MKPIYLDHNATTPLAPEVLESILPILKGEFGNPSSIHALGRATRVCLDESREQVAELIGAHPAELIFTSGGTESDNFAIFGVARALKEKCRHLITCEIEHPAVLNSFRQLEQEGFRVDYLPVDEKGYVDPENVLAALKEDTALVSIQHANSEVGTVQDIQRIATACRERGVLVHTDAVQSAGKLPIDVEELSVDLLSLSAHKLYGPKGIGALWIKRGTPPLVPLVFGGGQEKKRRGGTENVPGIVGFGKAAEIATSRLESDASQLTSRRDRLKNKLMERIPDLVIHGDPERGLPNTLSVAVKGVSGETLLVRLDLQGISISTGTACSSGVTQPSEVLQALGVPTELIEGTLRLSLGRSTTEEDVDQVVEVLSGAVEELRSRKRA